MGAPKKWPKIINDKRTKGASGDIGSVSPVNTSYDGTTIVIVW